MEAPMMATANDKKFSDARWQAQGPKVLEPTITYRKQVRILVADES